MLISLAKFRDLVDQVKPQLSKDASPEEAKAFVGIQHEPHYQRHRIGEMLRARVRESFTAGHRNIFFHCRDLLTELIHNHEANGIKLDPYYEILSVMRDAIRGDAHVPEVKGNWAAAVQAAVNHSEWCGPHHINLYEQLHAAEIQIARAVRRVKAVGKSGRPGDAPQILPEEQRRVLARTIEANFIRHMGAAHVAKHLFYALAPKFDNLQERYQDVDQFGFGASMQPRLPIGLLINYAAKYPLPKLPKKQRESDWGHLLQTSKDFAAVYGVQPRSNMDAIHVDQMGLLPFMRRLSIHDAMFSIQQTRPSDVIKIINGLATGLREVGKFPEHLDTEVDNLTQVIQAMQAVIGKRRGPVRFKSKDVADACTSLSESQVANLMRDVLAHPPGAANVNFIIPDEIPNEALPRQDRAGPNYGDRPLLTLQQDAYLLLDHSVNAPAMIEAVLTRLRQRGLDGDIGYGIEGLLHAELSSKSISTKTGKYIAEKKTWECDIVIETDQRIFFVEIKKKSLTRAARAGSDVALLVDMADSLVSATLQAMRHELMIKRDGFLDLTQADESVLRIDLKGRSVECIAVTLPDYGSFQDRIILAQFLGNGMKLEFSSDDKDLQTKLNKVNKKLDELRKINKDLYLLANQPSNWQPFFHCWFLSVPQFLVLLDGVSSPEGFNDAMQLTRHMSTGTQDFYFNLQYAKTLKATQRVTT